VKWRNCPSKILLPEEVFLKNFRKKVFRKKTSSGRRICDFRKYQKVLPEERHPEVSGKTFFWKLPEEPSSGNYLF